MSAFFENVDLAKAYLAHRPKCHAKVIDAIIEYAKERRQLSPGDNYHRELMLDAGCGSGQVTEGFASYFDSIIGFDASKAQVEAAQSANVHPNIRYIQARGERIPAADSSVDLVTCGDAVHYMDSQAFVRECNRVLRPSGCAAIISGFTSGMEYRGCDASDEDTLRTDCDSAKAIQEFYATIGSGNPSILSVLNRYRDVEEVIKNREKRRVEVSFDRPTTLAAYHKHCSTHSAYNIYMEKLTSDEREAKDPLLKMMQKLKKLWQVCDRDEDEIAFTLKMDYYVLLFASEK